MALRFEQSFESLEERTVLARGIAGSLFGTGCTHQLAQLLCIGVRVLAEECAEGIVAAEKALSPVFEQMHARYGLAAVARRVEEGLAQRSRVDFAHEFADVLGMAPTPLVRVDALHFAQGLAQAVRYIKDVDAMSGKRSKAFAQILKGLHLSLELAFAGGEVQLGPSIFTVRLCCRSA